MDGGGVEGYQNQILEDESGNGLSSVEIFECLLSLPRKFASIDPRAKQPIFVGFGASYDMAQILADLPNKKCGSSTRGKNGTGGRRDFLTNRAFKA